MCNITQDTFKIEILLKIENIENSLFNDCSKIIASLNLNDNLSIYQDETEYKISANGEVFDFSITMEPSKDVFSLSLAAVLAARDHLASSDILDNLTNTAREIKKTISENFKNCSYEILWDDVGIYYATMAFPMIIKIENLMRKLITKFMLVTVGMDFFTNIPKDINVRDSKDTDSGFLHNVDFIELSKYLFNPRPLKSTENLIKIINQLTDNHLPEDINLLEYQYNSHWNRYFKNTIESSVGTDGDTIKKQWEDFYQLRCKVAHSGFLRLDEYEKIKTLYSYLKNIFISALDKSGVIELSTENKEAISEDIITEIEGDSWSDILYSIIIENFDDEFTSKEIYTFEPILKALYPNNNTVQASIRRNLQKLRDNGKIVFLDSGRYKIKQDS